MILYIVCPQRPLPWISCDNAWNTCSCKCQHNDCQTYSNSSLCHPQKQTSSTNEFYRRKILHNYDKGSDLHGEFNYQLIIAYFAVWLLMILASYLNVRKITKLTSCFIFLAFLMMLTVFIKCLTLDGASIRRGH